VRDLFIDGNLPRPAYEEKKSLIRDEIDAVRTELAKVDDLDAEMGRVEDLRETLLSIEKPPSGHYALKRMPEDLDAVEDYHLGYGSKETAAKRRQEFYPNAGSRVKVGQETVISLGVDGISVGAEESASGSIRNPKGTP